MTVIRFYLKFIIICLSIVLNSCSNIENKSNDIIENTYQMAYDNYNTYRDSVTYFWRRIATINASELKDKQLAMFMYVKGNYMYDNNLYDSALNAYNNGAKALIKASDLKISLLLNAAACAKKTTNETKYDSLVEKADAIIKKNRNPSKLARLKGFNGTIASQNRQYKQAIKCYHEVDSILKTHHINKKRSLYIYYLGRLYGQIGDYPKAFSFLQESIELAQKNHEYYLLPRIYQNMSRIYRKIKRYDEALKWQNEHFKYAQKLNDKNDIWNAFDGLGIIYAEMNKWDSSEFYFRKSLELTRTTNDPSKIAVAKTNLAKFYDKKGYIQIALEKYQEAFNFRLKNNLLGLGYLKNLYELGNLNLKNKNTNMAIDYFKKVLQHLDTIPNIKVAKNTHNKLAIIYKQKKDYTKWMEHTSTYAKLDKELESRKASEQLYELMVKYEASEKEKTIQFQKHQLKEKQRLTFFLSITTFCLLTVIILLVFRYRDKVSTLKTLYRQEKEKQIQKQLIDNLRKQLKNKAQDSSKNTMLSDLLELLETKQVYRQTDISLEKLAQLLHTNTSYTSQLINKEFNCNFKTLINRYRINYSKKNIQENNLNIQPLKQIASNAGFISLSTFYTCFKKETGMTPNEYKTLVQLDKN